MEQLQEGLHRLLGTEVTTFRLRRLGPRSPPGILKRNEVPVFGPTHQHRHVPAVALDYDRLRPRLIEEFVEAIL